MRVLVTGAEGFVGSHLLDALASDDDHEVVAGCWAGRLPADRPARTTPDGALARIREVPLDVTSSESVEGVLQDHQPHWVFHLAAQSSVGRSFADPLGTWEVNATGTLRLAEALRARAGDSTRVLVISSAEVYGPVPAAAQPIGEDAPLRPTTPYGASKAAAEFAALQTAAQGGLQVVIARSFNHAGPGQDERFFLPSMARQLIRMKGAPDPVVRVGNVAVTRDFLDVRDVVRAYLSLMKSGENGGVYNVCSGEPRSLLDLVARLIELSGSGARLEVDPERFRSVDIPMLIGDAARLRALGWKAEIDLEQTLRDLLSEADAASQAEDR